MNVPSTALDATWPAAATLRAGPWLVRDGRGGGKRVSCASLAEDAGPDGWRPEDIALAEAAQRELGQPSLFMIRPGEEALDAELAARGYDVVDPVVILAAPAADLAAVIPPPISAFTIWPPLAIQIDLWAEGGIGPDRIAVMDRVTGARAAVLGRTADRAAATAFVAIAGGDAMLHALHVVPDLRRRGCARHVMHQAAIWAHQHGAQTLSVAVTRANDRALALYASLGMAIVGQYHYRLK